MEYINTNTNIIEAKNQFSRFEGKDFRPGQQEAIQHIQESDRKVVVVCGPTGSGKSLIGMVTGSTHDRFCYLCSSKQLQRQLTHDFPEAKYMTGRGNFECNQDPHNRTADLCIHTKATPCDLKGVCNYEIHKRAVLDHPIQILNYHYLLNEANYVGKFSDYPIIICDEADTLEGLLTGFIELRLSRSKLDTLNLSPPRYRTATAKNGLVAWQKWAREESRKKVHNRLHQLDDYMSNLDPNRELTQDDYRVIREHRSLESLNSKLSIFSTHMDESWIFQEQSTNGHADRWIFQPTWLTQDLSHQYFFQHGEKFVLMSATFPPKAVLAEMLGLSTEDIGYIELPSTFPESHRPVYLNPVADMSYRTFEDDLPKLLSEIERILNKHPDEKGLIHSVSWKLDGRIMKHLHNPRLIFHSSNTKDEQLARFKASTNGVFVSPSSTRGVDLPDDDCRFIIIAKAPFQSLGDKLVSSRVHGNGMGAYWYRAVCALDLVQASGRGVRHKEDHCTTYLLDKQIEKLVVDNQNLFPRYWIKSVDYV
jgi:Rad3-related DNA helicase